MTRSGFTRSVRGKVITALVLSCCALLLAWAVSKGTFRRMLGAVQHTSAANSPWRVASALSAGIARLEGLQRQDLRPLHLLIDTLRGLYAGDSLRSAQVNTLEHLLGQRDKLVSDYLRVRAEVVEDSSLSHQVFALAENVRNSPPPKDSTVVTTERKSYTTTVYPGQEPAHPQASRGFFRKLFGKKKASPPAPAAAPYQVVREETRTHVDTIATAAADTTADALDARMQDFERHRRRCSTLFLDREAQLAAASDRLNRQILLVLKQVEQDAVERMEASNARAEEVVHTGITRINAIMFTFFLVTAVLLYFILTDIARGNAYREEIETARDQAEYHSKAKQRFLSNMSHEIRTPLQSIVGYSERIRAQGFAAHKDIDALHHSAEHLLQIVNEVLDYNRIVSGKFTFTRRVFRPLELLDEIVSVLRLQADEKGLALTTRYALAAPATPAPAAAPAPRTAALPGAPALVPFAPAAAQLAPAAAQQPLLLEGDPFRLKQVLYNLLGNAIKFTTTGWVNLDVRYEDGHLICAISDTGPGIAPEDLERVFQEFEQAESRSGPSGTGLGLPISKALVEAQGGRIVVASTPGEGSCFTVTLPYTIAPVPLPEHVQLPHSIARHKKTWILDDDPFILDVCSWILDRHHIAHRCFSSPAALLNEPWDGAVCYVLLDIRMPGMSGFEVCATLRDRIPPGVRIFALTAQVLPDEQARVLEGGFDGILLKPFTERDLLGIFEEAAPATPVAASPDWDPSPLERMTLGDKAQLNQMLRHFARDQRQDKVLLANYLRERDFAGALLLVHRIAGRTGQVGARRLSTDLRRMEKTLTHEQILDDASIKQLLGLCAQLDTLIAKAEEMTEAPVS
ncbi:ATP-binding protein [Dinghuibacter silviterrae]|uniref:histidine kinase n=1 Tax=Dinghuibacter silviterrae TaxID=1539049 RepID=A0A4R8DS32_9BACT|nr:ATP-binding protein [Dinghuibacter silviterrae]TDX00819.1 signal transduction histidine kinase [Dinghuibacter silviterrae]